MAAQVRLARLARRQRGVFTRAQALECGYSKRTIARRVASGAWIEMHRGVYALPASTDTPFQRVLAAAFAVGKGAVASHVTALAVWGLGDMKLEPPYHITVPGRCQRKPRGVVVHQSTTLRRADRAVFRDIPVVRVPKALADADRDLPLHVCEDLLVEAFRRGLANRGHFHEVLALLPNRAGGLRGLLDNFDPDQARQLMSWAETCFLVDVVRRHGFVEPDVNRRLFLPGRLLVARVDFRWPGHNAGVEVDGLRFHSTPSQKDYDDSRQNELVLSGERLLRYSAAKVFDEPDSIAADLRRLLGGNGH